jgi:hypothetical protein
MFAFPSPDASTEPQPERVRWDDRFEGRDRMKIVCAIVASVALGLAFAVSPAAAQGNDPLVKSEPPPPGSVRNPFPKRPEGEKRLVCTTDKDGNVKCVWQ